MKIECVHVCITGSPCFTVEKNCIGEITIKNIVIKKKKIGVTDEVKLLVMTSSAKSFPIKETQIGHSFAPVINPRI